MSQDTWIRATPRRGCIMLLKGAGHRALLHQWQWLHLRVRGLRPRRRATTVRGMIAMHGTMGLLRAQSSRQYLALPSSLRVFSYSGDGSRDALWQGRMSYPTIARSWRRCQWRSRWQRNCGLITPLRRLGGIVHSRIREGRQLKKQAWRTGENELRSAAQHGFGG